MIGRGLKILVGFDATAATKALILLSPYSFMFSKLKKLFGSKETKSKTAFLTVPELESEVSAAIGSKSQELELICGKEMAEIKFLHSRATVLIGDIKKKEIEGKENERFNKAAFTSKSHVELQLMRVLQKIDPKEHGMQILDTRAYTEEAIAVLVKEVIHFRKSIVYTSVYLKDEMKALGEILQQLLEKLQALKKEFDERKDFFEAEKLEKQLKELKTAKENVLLEKEKAKQAQESLKEKEKFVEVGKDKLVEFGAGEKMIVIKQLEEEKQKLLSEKQELKTEVSSLLSTIDKPLQRFKQLVDSGRWKLSREEKNTLDGFITNPIIALRADPKGENFKKILTNIVKAIEDEKIDFKEKEKEKKLQALNDIIAFDFFDKMFWRMNEIQKKQIELEKSLAESKYYDEKEKLESKLHESKRVLVEKEDLLKNQTSAVLAAENIFEEKKKSIEEIASKILKKSIYVKPELDSE